MPDEIQEPDAPPPFEPVALANGDVWTGTDGDAYLVTTTDGRVVPYLANGELSAANIEADIANPAPILATADQIKAEANRRILALAPDWKQRNAIARFVELDRKTDPLTAEEQAQYDAIETLWAVVRAIRAHSDALEANPPIVATLTAAGWPA